MTGFSSIFRFSGSKGCTEVPFVRYLITMQLTSEKCDGKAADRYGGANMGAALCVAALGRLPVRTMVVSLSKIACDVRLSDTSYRAPMSAFN